MPSYGMLLIVPLVVELARASRDPRRRGPALALCATLTLLSGITVFGAALLMWLLLVGEMLASPDRVSACGPASAGLKRRWLILSDQ